MVFVIYIVCNKNLTKYIYILIYTKEGQGCPGRRKSNFFYTKNKNKNNNIKKFDFLLPWHPKNEYTY